MNIIKKFALVLMLAAAVAAAKDTLSFAGVGDILVGRNWPDATPVLPPEDGASVFKDAKDILRGVDVAFGNLEGVFLDSGGTPKQCSNPSMCHNFRMPERYVKHFVDAGFDLLNVANNHSGDFGDAGRKTTARVLQEAGIGFAGFVGTHETYVLEKGGIRYGLVGFAPNIGTVSIHDIPRAQQLVRELKAKSDIVIVSSHMGAEGAKHANITRKPETFVGENRGNPYEFARQMIDAGADIFFGHGPHVVRAMDLYKGKFIVYSLGNFATTTGMNINGTAGYAPIVTIRTDRHGNFIDGQIHSFIQSGVSGERRPFADPTGACIKEFKRLTEADIPEVGLTIGNDGKIRLK
ncbi:MAG: CapA family protein [Chitinispirillia bacterium]|nr:CapA family protein [Chitinispirillia bacterium]MCL2268483.1 CapA family protein [Chitinispirillia bacterium]